MANSPTPAPAGTGTAEPLPANTADLLMALHAEFYGGPKADAGAFRVLPRVVASLATLTRQLAEAQQREQGLRQTLMEIEAHAATEDNGDPEWTCEQIVKLAAAALDAPTSPDREG